MNPQEKALSHINDKREYYYSQFQFCSERKFTLEAEMFRRLHSETNDLYYKLKDIFDI